MSKTEQSSVLKSFAKLETRAIVSIHALTSHLYFPELSSCPCNVACIGRSPSWCNDHCASRIASLSQCSGDS